MLNTESLKKLEFKAVSDYQLPLSSCLIEEKIDGIRLILVREMALTRGRNNWWDKLPTHLQNIASDIPVDGELHWPGHPATDIVTGLKHKSPELRFTGFYLPFFSGKPLEHRRRIRIMNFHVPNLYGPETYITPPSLKRLEEVALLLKLEGWVLKEESYPYWWKIKLEKTYDLIVTRFNIATTGRHQGKLKSLRCSAYIQGNLIEVANVSGMNDVERYAFDPNIDIGRVVEVRAQFRAAKGRLRHPRFIRWRDDKPAKECVL